MDLKVFEARPGMCVVVLPDAPAFTVLAVSDDFVRVTGMPRENMTGKGLFETFPQSPDDPRFTDKQKLAASFHYILQHKKPHRIPQQRHDVPNGDGSFAERYWTSLNLPVLDNSGDVQYIIHTPEDITLLVKAAQLEEMKGIEERYSLFMQAPVPIQVYKGPNLVLELVNEATLALWGKEPGIAGKPLLEALPEMEGQGYIELLLQVMETGVPKYIYDTPATFIVNGKEELHYFDTVYQPYYHDQSARPTGVAVFGFDVTQKVLAEKALEENERELRDMVLHAPIGICIVDASTMVSLVANERFVEIAGKPMDAIVGNMYWDTFAEARPFYEAAMRQVVEEGITYRAEDAGVMLIRHGKEETIHVSFVYEPLKNSEGTVKKVAVWVLDNTSKVMIRRRLEESESNLRNMILHSPVAMCILTGPQFVLDIANERMIELMGGRAGQIMHKPIFDSLPEAGSQGLRQEMEKVYATGNTFIANELAVPLPRNGKLETAYVNFIYEPFRAGDGTITGVMAVAIEVTGLVQARLKVEESNQAFRFVTDFMPQMIWTTRPDGYHEFYNKRWYDYTGLSYEETKDTGWNTVLHPGDRERAWKVWKHSLNTGEPYEIEYRFRRYDGEYRWFLGRALPQKDEQGNILKWFGTCTDIDEQKKAAELMEQRIEERTRDLKEANEDLKRMNEELEQFSYVSHHDLQESLRKILVFTGMIKSDSYDRLTEASRKQLEKIHNAAQRMSGALQDILNFASLGKEEQMETVDLNKVLATVQNDVELVMEEKEASIFSEKLPSVKAVAHQMHQLLYNLVNNALKFSKPGQAPVIHITCRLLSDTELLKHPELQPSRPYYQITVRDNGIGFHAAAAEKIFGIFQRLHHKEAYSGTGIGLALCRKVVTNHGGKIWAESRPGEGASFVFLLPG